MEARLVLSSSATRTVHAHPSTITATSSTTRYSVSLWHSGSRSSVVAHGSAASRRLAGNRGAEQERSILSYTGKLTIRAGKCGSVAFHMYSDWTREPRTDTCAALQSNSAGYVRIARRRQDATCKAYVTGYQEQERQKWQMERQSRHRTAPLSRKATLRKGPDRQTHLSTKPSAGGGRGGFTGHPTQRQHPR